MIANKVHYLDTNKNKLTDKFQPFFVSRSSLNVSIASMNYLRRL